MQHAAAMWQWELGKMEMQREPIYHKYSPQKLINSCNNQLVLLVLNICWYKGSNGVACLADAAAWGERQNLISREHETQTGLTADSVTVNHVDQGFTTLIIRVFWAVKVKSITLRGAVMDTDYYSFRWRLHRRHHIDQRLVDFPFACSTYVRYVARHEKCTGFQRGSNREAAELYI